MKKIAIIPARSGSKGLVNKNVLLVNGKPLIGYSIEAALNSRCFDKIIVTTDSQEYIDLLSDYKVDFIKRAKDLSTDKASSFCVIEDVIQKYRALEFDYFVLLQPTSPQRTAAHIQDACLIFEEQYECFDSLVSVSRVDKPSTLIHPIGDDKSLKNFELDYSGYLRQNNPFEYSPNGAIFLAKSNAYLQKKQFFGEECLAYIMDKSVSIDIDDELDFEYFYFLEKKRKQENLLDRNIQNRIDYKTHHITEDRPITFIGHSILDNWEIEVLNNMTISNLAISGISTDKYIEVFDRKLIKSIGEYVVLMLGTNDIIQPEWNDEKISCQLNDLIVRIKNLSSDCLIYFLEITPTAFRIDRKNEDIVYLNKYLKKNLKNIVWVDLYDNFCDVYGKLNLSYTNDGLHLNAKGYDLLQKILEKKLLP